MASITVVCDECGETVDGLLDVATDTNDDPILLTGGFYVYESGVSCDECVAGNAGPENELPP